MNCDVTTARKAGTLLVGEAKKFAEQWQGQYVTRGELSLEMLRQQEGVEKMVIFSVGGPVIEGIGWRYFYHPSMAALRALQWERNGQDALIQALALAAGGNGAGWNAWLRSGRGLDESCCRCDR